MARLTLAPRGRIALSPTARIGWLATIAALCVSVVYLPQPLIPLLARDLGLTDVEAGWIATAVPVGYALGTVTLIPVTDRVPLRRMVLGLLGIGVLLLGVTSQLSHLAPLIVGFGLVGACATVAQMLLPEVLRLAPAGTAGRATGFVAGAFAFGIFGGRMLSALVGEAVGWRGAVLVVAGLMVVAMLIAALALTARPAETHSYAAVLRSLWLLITRNPTLRRAAIVQALLFGIFQLAWTASVFVFTEPPHSWSVSAAGLAGLAGIAGGVATFLASGLVDRWGVRRVMPLFILVAAAAGALLFLHTIAAVVLVALFLLTVVSQTAQGATQSLALMSVGSANRGAGNTVYVFILFMGGSLGVGIATPLLQWAGPSGLATVVLAAAAAALALAVAFRSAAPALRR